MKRLLTLALFTYTCCAHAQTYVGSTPADKLLRQFLQVSLTDSVDFIRWKLELAANNYTLQCGYGISKPGTLGFQQEHTVSFRGNLSFANNCYDLKYQDRAIQLVQADENVLHFIGKNNTMLAGNGGYSYALNRTAPIKTGHLNLKPQKSTMSAVAVFQGRTPCGELSVMLNLKNCLGYDKLKWHVTFYTDSKTGGKTYLLKGSISYNNKNPERGTWKLITKPNGLIVYQLVADNGAYTLNLAKGDDNVLFFINQDGSLLVGNADFSYTLNRK